MTTKASMMASARSEMRVRLQLGLGLLSFVILSGVVLSSGLMR